jgi:hypothetical protein
VEGDMAHDEIKERLDKIDEKIDRFIEAIAKHEMAIYFLKLGLGASITTLVGIAVTMLFH